MSKSEKARGCIQQSSGWVERDLAFPLRDLGSHWSVWNRGVMPSDLGFNKLHLASGQRVDCGRARAVAERPVRKLLQ